MALFWFGKPSAAVQVQGKNAHKAGAAEDRLARS